MSVVSSASLRCGRVVWQQQQQQQLRRQQPLLQTLHTAQRSWQQARPQQQLLLQLGGAPPTREYHASAPRARGYVHKPRHPVPSITLRELRKAYKQKKRSDPVANQELMALLNSLGENNEDHHAPGVKRAASVVEAALQNRDRGSKKSYTLYQLARYVKRH